MSDLHGYAGYNASFSSDVGFVWFRVAKTGTRSLNFLLDAEVGDYHYVTRRDVVPPALVDLLAGSSFCFTFVRNPWDRLVSAWRDKLVKSRNSSKFLRQLSTTADDDDLAGCREDFIAFARLLPGSNLLGKNVHFQPQTEILGDIELDFVGRFEHFGADVEKALTTIGLGHSVAALPHRNQSFAGDHYSSFYDAETRDAVGDLFHDDLTRWGYTFETPT